MKSKLIRKVCKNLYEEIGPSAVYDFANILNLDYNYCNQCEAETPSLKGKECLNCGNPNGTTPLSFPVCKEKESEMIVSADNFVNLVVTGKAKELFGILELYGHPGDGSEFLIETQEQLEETIKSGMPICIEGGFFADAKRVKF